MEWFPDGKSKKEEANREKRIRKAQAVLKEINPDILLAQEVRDWASLEETVSVVPGLTVRTISRFSGRQQVAIASKLNVQSSWYEVFRAQTDNSEVAPPRGFAFAAIEVSPGVILLSYSVHLKSNVRTSPAEAIAVREESARQILAHLKKLEKVYGDYTQTAALVGGDFNTLQDQDAYSKEKTLPLFIESGFIWSWAGKELSERITWKGKEGFSDATFDHLFWKGLPASTASVLADSPASDHRPIKALLSQP